MNSADFRGTADQPLLIQPASDAYRTASSETTYLESPEP